jgi:integrase
MNLHDKIVKNAKPREKTYRLWDGEGLYLEVTPGGKRHWRMKYRFGERERTISFGPYPIVSLREARDLRYDARKLLIAGIDPSDEKKKAQTSGITFEMVAREWLAQQAHIWEDGYTRTVIGRLENDVFDRIGARSVETLVPTDILTVLRAIEKRGVLETAHRVQAIISQIFRYAVSTGRISSDPSRDLRGALAPAKAKNLPAITEPEKVGALLKMIHAYEGTDVVESALKLAPLVFVRPGELRQAEWKDIDLQAAEWCFVVTKTSQPHIVPLSRQAIDILNDIRLTTGKGRYVFPSLRSNALPMSNNAILAALRLMEIPKEQMCGHGFRAMARTLLDEALGFPPHLIEHQLAHTVKDALGRAYNRTKHLPERREMMQRWADYLDELRTKKDVAEG